MTNAPPLSDADLAGGVRLADELAANFPNELNARKGIIRRQLAVMVGALLREQDAKRAAAHDAAVAEIERLTAEVGGLNLANRAALREVDRLHNYQNETAKAWTKLTESQERELEELKERLVRCDGAAQTAHAENERLRARLGIVLAALRDFEEAVGETIDDDGGDIAGIEAHIGNLKAGKEEADRHAIAVMNKCTVTVEGLQAALKDMIGLYEVFAGEDECDGLRDDRPCGAPICKAIKRCAVNVASNARKLAHEQKAGE